MKKGNYCNECLIFHKNTIAKECDFCKKYEFQENILCELANKEKSEKFSCPGFKPYLSVVEKSNKGKMTSSKTKKPTDKDFSNKIIPNTNRF